MVHQITICQILYPYTVLINTALHKGCHHSSLIYMYFLAWHYIVIQTSMQMLNFVFPDVHDIYVAAA